MANKNKRRKSSSSYFDYREYSDYFNSNDDKYLKNDIKNVEKQKKFVVWVQEFSKKTVVVIFGFYILTSIFSLFLVYQSLQQGSISGIDTLISEINMTFREVVGGYLIKSAVENAVKIGGNYYVGVCDARLKSLKERVEMRAKMYNKDIENDSENNENNEELEFINLDE